MLIRYIGVWSLQLLNNVIDVNLPHALITLVMFDYSV